MLISEQYLSMYASIIGGEISRFALRDGSKEYNYLSQFGTMVIIKAIIPFNSLIRSQSEINIDDSVIMFIKCVAVYEEWFPLEHIRFIAQTDKNISPANIVDIEIID